MTVQKNSTQEVNVESKQDDISLDEVVVSTNRIANMHRVAPNLVNVMDTKLFESTHTTCLAQGLSFQPGVRVEDENILNGSMTFHLHFPDSERSSLQTSVE